MPLRLIFPQLQATPHKACAARYDLPGEWADQHDWDERIHGVDGALDCEEDHFEASDRVGWDCDPTGDRVCDYLEREFHLKRGGNCPAFLIVGSNSFLFF